MKQLGQKIDAVKFLCIDVPARPRSWAHSSSKAVALLGLFLPFSGCVMTQAQGDRMASDVREIKKEVAKLQRVRHDLESLMMGPLKELQERMAKIEEQVDGLRASLSEDSSHGREMLAELQSLRGALEEAQHKLEQMEKAQVARSAPGPVFREAVKDASAEELWVKGKELYSQQKYEEAAAVFQALLEKPEQQKERTGEAYFLLGESSRLCGEKISNELEKDRLQKKAVLAYSKAMEKSDKNEVREESIYRIGVLFQNMGSKKEAISAFEELLSKHKGSKRVEEAKRHLKDLKAEKSESPRKRSAH